MCIIAYKPAGAKFPSKSTIKTMFRNNPDGAGFMYTAPDGVHIVKGLMSVSAFMQALSQIKHDTSIPVVMHFRIATHGGYSESMTQPFPLTNKNKRLRALNTICDVGIAHNGIIHMCNDAKKISDTAMFIRDYMTRLTAVKKPFDDINLNIIEACIGSRMLILERTGDVHILGTGWIEDNDIIYSNDSYLDWTKLYKSSRKAVKKEPLLWDSYNAYSYENIEPEYDNSYCDGYCDSCVYRSSCWGTSSIAIDRGINSNDWR